MLEAIACGKPVAPRATFGDGYRIAEIVATIARSARSRTFETVNFRS